MDDMCNVGMCDASSGSCVAAPVTDGTTCDTGNICSWGDMCSSGACGGVVGDCSPASLIVPDTDATSGEGGIRWRRLHRCPASTVASGVHRHSGFVLDGIALRCASVMPTVM